MKAPIKSGKAGWQMSDAQSLGDRVKVDTISSAGETVTAFYYDYGPEQSMADIPNVRVENTYTYSKGKLIPTSN